MTTLRAIFTGLIAAAVFVLLSVFAGHWYAMAFLAGFLSLLFRNLLRSIG